MTASPFGFGAPQMRPEDLARLFNTMPLGAPQGFVPPADTVLPEQAVHAAPQRRPLSFGGPQRAQAPAGSVRVPLPPTRPPEFDTVAQADLPAPGAQAIMSAAQTEPPAAEGPSFLDRVMGGIRSSDGLLTSIATGLLTTPGLGQGIGAGLQAHQQGEGRRAASQLAQAEYGLKARELQRKERGENSTRSFLLSKGMSTEQADAAMANPTVLSSTLAQLNKDPSIVEIGGNKYRLGPNDRPSEANLLGPSGAPADTTTADQKNYEEAKRGGYAGSFLDYQVLKANAGKAQTTINNAVNPVLKGLGDQFVEGAQGARASADAVRSVQNARSQLEAPGGIYSGAFAENQLALQKLGSFLGVADPAAIQNTETFRTQIKPIVLDTVKGLGAGSGVSNADRDFAMQAVGSDIKLDEGTIRRVLDITERSARAKIERHNSLASQMLETQPELKQIAPMLQVEMPQGMTPAAQPAALPQGARQARDGKWYVPDPNRAGKYLEVR